MGDTWRGMACTSTEWTAEDSEALDLLVILDRVRFHSHLPFMTRPQRKVIVRWLHDLGWTDGQISDRLGVCRESVNRSLQTLPPKRRTHTYRGKRTLPARRIDLTGQTFGRWKVLTWAGMTPSGTAWWCQCACGHKAQVRSIKLRSGASTKCATCGRTERGTKAKPLALAA